MTMTNNSRHLHAQNCSSSIHRNERTAVNVSMDASTLRTALVALLPTKMLPALRPWWTMDAVASMYRYRFASAADAHGIDAHSIAVVHFVTRVFAFHDAIEWSHWPAAAHAGHARVAAVLAHYCDLTLHYICIECRPDCVYRRCQRRHCCHCHFEMENCNCRHALCTNSKQLFGCGFCLGRRHRWRATAAPLDFSRKCHPILFVLSFVPQLPIERCHSRHFVYQVAAAAVAILNCCFLYNTNRWVAAVFPCLWCWRTTVNGATAVVAVAAA